MTITADLDQWTNGQRGISGNILWPTSNSTPGNVHRVDDQRVCTTPKTLRLDLGGVASPRAASVADVLFRALHLAFSRRTAAAGASPPWRSAAFAKRLLSAALHWPPTTAARAIGLVAELVECDPKLEALLSTEDRAGNGVYRPDVDDPQVCNAFGSSFWELHTLAAAHWAEQVRVAAGKLLDSHSSSSV